MTHLIRHDYGRMTMCVCMCVHMHPFLPKEHTKFCVTSSIKHIPQNGKRYSLLLYTYKIFYDFLKKPVKVTANWKAGEAMLPTQESQVWSPAPCGPPAPPRATLKNDIGAVPEHCWVWTPPKKDLFKPFRNVALLIPASFNRLPYLTILISILPSLSTHE